MHATSVKTGPQNYLVHDNKLYYIGWTSSQPPTKLIEKDSLIYWITKNGTIFQTDMMYNNPMVIPQIYFYELTKKWNIEISKFLNTVPQL